MPGSQDEPWCYVKALAPGPRSSSLQACSEAYDLVFGLEVEFIQESGIHVTWRGIKFVRPNRDYHWQCSAAWHFVMLSTVRYGAVQCYLMQYNVFVTLRAASLQKDGRT